MYDVDFGQPDFVLIGASICYLLLSYERSAQGWNATAKTAEIFDVGSRFLILAEDRQDASSCWPAAFLVWRFDTEECDAADTAQRRRPGRRKEEEIEVAYWWVFKVLAMLTQVVDSTDKLTRWTYLATNYKWLPRTARRDLAGC